VTTNVTLSAYTLDSETVLRLESDLLQADIVPSIGGRVISLVHKPSGCEYLWRNPALHLQRSMPGDAYDPVFFGGIDEQIPCDGPEVVDGVTYPDHGELWTQALEPDWDGVSLCLDGHLPVLGFHYQRWIELVPGAAEVRLRYRLENHAGVSRDFLWKLHAALAVGQDDRIVCPATWAQPLDLDWSRSQDEAAFAWPQCGELDMSLVPAVNNTAEFLVLSDLASGEIGWQRPSTGRQFNISFDRAVFPCCWIFASYGKLLGHYTLVLEPATSPILSLVDAKIQGKAIQLQAGGVLETEVVISVG
jgi:hypothetical protein